MNSHAQQALDKALKGPAFEKRVKRRNAKDSVSAWGISVGGVGVILSVLLIMVFLLYVVLPLFTPASVDRTTAYPVPGGQAEKTLYYGLDEYQETALRFTQSGALLGFDVATGEAISQSHLPLAGSTITSFTVISEMENVLAFGLSNGGLLIAKYGYAVTYPDDVRTITPRVEFPFGEEAIALADGAIEKLAIRQGDASMTVAFKVAGSAQIELREFDKIESMLSDSITLEAIGEGRVVSHNAVDWLLLDVSKRNLYTVSADGQATYFDVRDVSEPLQVQQVSMLAPGERLTTLRFLLGEYSLMLGTNRGEVIQWFPVRDANNDYALQEIRRFKAGDAPILNIAIEKARKGFAATDAAGHFNLFHSTAERHLNTTAVSEQGAGYAVLASRADGALVETDDGQLVHYSIHNPHADVSFSSLWGKVWYENYSEPQYVWQSSSASSDFEPKFSMTPITFGTIKAALYSMLFAVPIAVLAAIFTAFFMDKKTRQWIKPSVELIEALPTVILGFLAGLWLAPYMEQNLAGFFALLVVMPLGIMLFGFGWANLPEKIRLLVPVGKRVILLVPVVLSLGWLAFALSDPLENTFFNGDMRHWLTFSAGIDFDQRNAMVIGFAMGFALIPTIFSVAEDAIYNVPSYLVNGSLALGASGWQTLVGVVLPTASPGIFSAIMLGFGRGVGETMIVLMASGNTPLMETNLFEGMRTLSANLAVEMPEAAVDSSHYRVLFLSGLVLFIFTFIFNTLAEVVRQRMRRKYGSL